MESKPMRIALLSLDFYINHHIPVSQIGTNFNVLNS
jgi:hypothetical protein